MNGRKEFDSIHNLLFKTKSIIYYPNGNNKIIGVSRLVTGGWSILPEETKCDRGVLKVNSSDSAKYSVWPFAN